MKTTVEISDNLFRKAKSTAASQGRSLKDLLNEALSNLLTPSSSQDKPWMKFCGAISKKEARQIMKVVDEEFERIDPEDWK